MEKTKLIVYWIATALLSFGMLGSGIAQLLHSQDMVDLISHVGYPLYFMYIIGTWKVLGVIVILLPGFALIKEWAYAGLFFVMTGAFFSHILIGDGISELLGPFFQTVFIILSWYFRPANRRLALN
jgi:hypothetical protein